MRNGRLRSGVNWTDLAFSILKWMVLTLFLAMTTLPFLYLLLYTLRGPGGALAGPYWIPKNPSMVGWPAAIRGQLRPMWISFTVASGTTIISLSIAIPGAYVFARSRFPGRRLLFYAIIVTLLFPHVMLAIPITDVWYDVGLYDTVVGLWFAYQVFVTPFAIWILRDFFRQIPASLEEAALVYGHTRLSAFVRVVLPLTTPAILATGFLVFLFAWNDYLFANLLTTPGGPVPAVVNLLSNNQSDTVELLIVGTPPTVLFLLARRQLFQAFVIGD